MNYYVKHGHHKDNVEQFEKLVAANPKVLFFQPSPILAPWHVQTVINDVVLNFWPHLLKGQRDGCRAKTGMKALQQLIDEAIESDDFHVVD